MSVVLVEGESDRLALQAAAAGRGRDLAGEGVDLVVMGGVTNLARALAEIDPRSRVLGLCDAGEARFVARVLGRASMPADGWFVCDRDLEDELLRAIGPSGFEAVIEREGELDSLRKLQQMPYHRSREVDEHLRRFITTRSGRKYRYAPILVDALGPDRLPAPLRDLLDAL